MNDRFTTPDILGSIMTGTASNKTLLQEIQQEIKQESNKATTKTTPRQQSEEELKEKATFNLPCAILSELEDKCHEMRKLCKSKQVSKTLIVEEALRIVFQEFESKKHTSRIFQRIAGNKAIKQ